MRKSLTTQFPDVKKRREKRKLYGVLSADAGYEVQRLVAADPDLIGTTQRVWLTASDDTDMYFKGNIRLDQPSNQRRLNDTQIGWLEALKSAGMVEVRFNAPFFTSGDSREPELAGILGAVIGSFFTLLVCFFLSFPVGVLAAIYLEEFAPKNAFFRFIEVNINNLAAVPSIVFGLLGLAVLLNTFELPRSTPLVGGAVLALMTLPTIIIASRAALRAVPPSIRQAALGLGASHLQATFHHVAPLAMPGMLTGAIIGMAQALGETAPLLMIGMVAFIADMPTGITDAATALPVQIFLWADSPERAFLEKTSAAIIVLLIFLVIMNLTAVLLRKSWKYAGEGSRKNGHSCRRADDRRVSGIGAKQCQMSSKNVNVFYGEKQALIDISLDILENQVTALIGPSGCGKSTYLRCLNRMNDVIPICRVEGEIDLDGQDIYHPAVDVVALRARVGMVFQKPNPFPKSIYDNVAYGPRIHGMATSKAEMDEIVEYNLERAGLIDEVHDRLSEPGTGLSGGQQQRLCIARAMAVRPDVILMDEPCSALDPIATAKIEELIDELKAQFTFVIVTHSMHQAARASQRTAFFHLGRLVEVGETAQIFTNPADERTESYVSGRIG